MAANRQIALTAIECRALWLIADVGLHCPLPELERDPFLESAAERALDKVFRADKGMGRKGVPKPPGSETPRSATNPGIDLTRKGRPAA